MEETFYKISESELRALLTASHKLDVLEQDGVDNWSWYMESKDEYIRLIAEANKFPGNWNEDHLDFEELVENEIELYERI